MFFQGQRITVTMVTDIFAHQSSWKIEQSGQVMCSKYGLSGDDNKKHIETICCIDLEKEYTITCMDTGSDGWDYIGESIYGPQEDPGIDGYLMVGNIKYCDIFEEKRKYKISGNQHTYFLFFCSLE